MYTKELLKKDFINYGVVEENEYLDKYIEIIINNLLTPQQKYITDKHHIIPRYYYKYKNIEVNNSAENIVNLKRADHMLAHLYLWACSTEPFKYASGASILQLSAKFNNGHEIDDIENFILKNEKLINEAKEDFARRQSDRYKGKPHKISDQGRKNVSEAAKKVRKEKNNSGKTGLVYNGKYMFITKDQVQEYLDKGATLGRWPHSEESKESNRQKHLGKSHEVSEEVRKKISESNKGKKMSEESIQKMIETNK